jgi:antitoxin component YwqK of YwqJK toxin-antitoxin module
MKRVLFFLLSIFLMASCTTEYEELTEDSWDDGSPKTVKVYEIDGDDRILHKEIAYYENNQKRLEGEFKDGKRDGYWQYWYENGHKWSEGYFKEGRRNGMGKTYHDNGQIYVDGTYQDDIRVGAWRFYDRNGVLLKEIDYDE